MYLSAIGAALFFPLILLSLKRQKYSPRTKSEFKEEYDYIIVGAGSAGSVVASRLSEIPCVSVLLLEAGKEPPLLTEIPRVGRLAWSTGIDWDYYTVPQKNSGFALVNNQVPWPLGKVLGGSSVLDGMVYMRGNRKNYDDWAKNGSEGWSYSDVFPYFLKLEDNKDPAYLGNGFHSVGGPITVQTPVDDPEIKNGLLKAAAELGYDVIDPNGPSQVGFYVTQLTTRDGQRCSTAKGYLVPAEHRRNLDIVSEAFVKKVLFKNKRASGVSVDFKGKTLQVRARKEVIISAGTVKTAQLLLLSGIGPIEELKANDIPVVADLPVGKNLHDHPSTFLVFKLNRTIPSVAKRSTTFHSLNDYLWKREGPLSSIYVIEAFLNGDRKDSADFPLFQLSLYDFIIQFTKDQFGIKPEIYEEMFAPYEDETAYVCEPKVLQPRSRGTVTLRTDDPNEPPLIEPNYFQDSRDLQDLVQGMKECLKIGKSPPMQELGSKLLPTPVPNCRHLFDKDEDAYLECYARNVLISSRNPVGTVKMGDPFDPATVVDPQLRVRDVEGLRVVDASIMPIIPSGNKHIPTVMVAEKASDIIKRTVDCWNKKAI